MPENDSAERFVKRLDAHRSPEQREKYRRYFKLGEGEYGEGDEFVGVRMGQVFALAKEFIEMPPEEIEKLLESPIHEVRAGGLSIMDKQARRKRTPESRRKELFDLYMRRTDRINNWDLVDAGLPVCRRRLPVQQAARRPLRAGALRATRVNAAPPSSAPTSSSGTAMWTTPSGSPRCCSTTRRT